MNRMKKMKKISALFMALAMVLSMFAGTELTAKAAGNNAITVTKYAIDNQDDYNNLTKRADGKEITDGSLDGYTPLAGVEFRLSKAVDVDGNTTVNNVKLDRNFGTNGHMTRVTDAAGVVNFTGLEDGYYLLEELQTAEDDIKVAMEPVLIQLPLPIKDEGALTHVFVYPKNMTDADAPKIEKDVIQYGNNDAGVNVGETFDWIINAKIPENVDQGSVYKVTDYLDSRLDFVADPAPVVKADTTTLAAGTDYNFTSGGDGRTLVFDFTAAGRTALENSGAKKVTITFQTKVNDTAEMGVSIPNQANLTYTNSANKTFDTKSDRPEVHTGGAFIYKVDGVTKEPLPGAVFGIYDTKEKAKIHAAGTEIQKATSDADGNVVFKGLAYGEIGKTTLEGETAYWIAELVAPTVNGATYNVLTEPIEVKINATSHEEGMKITVENNKNSFDLPFTGGVGTTVFTLGGIALLGAAFILLIRGRRKENA